MKSTKKALFTSVLSLLLCVSMLIGTTFAWFTDSVTSGTNQIVAGNLDVEVSYKDNGTWKSIQDATSLFSKGLWEPGHTEYVTLKIENKGTLALNYKMLVTPVSESGGINVAGQNFKLSDYLMFGTTEASTTEPSYTRESARAAVAATQMGLTQSGLTQGNGMEANSSAQYVTLVIYMPENVGNEANYKTGTAAPFIELGITVLATQKVSENDSFGPDYDAHADLKPDLVDMDSLVYDFLAPVFASGNIQKTASDTTTINATNIQIDTTTKDVTIKSDNGETSVKIPASAIPEGDHEIALNVSKASEPENFSVGEGKGAIHYEVTPTIDGVPVVALTSDGEYYVVTIPSEAGLENEDLYHEGVLMAKDTPTTSGGEYFTYNATTGAFTAYVKHCSPFSVTFDAAAQIIGEKCYGTLYGAIRAAKSTETVKVLKDVTLANYVYFSKDITLDLNGHTVDETSYGFYVDKGTTMTIKNGTVKTYGFDVRHGVLNLEGVTVIDRYGNYGPIWISGTDDSAASDYSVVNIDKNSTVKSSGYYAICIYDYQKNWNRGYGVVLNVDGKIESEYGMSISGNYGTKSNAVINLNAGSAIDTGLYIAANSVWNVNGTVDGGIYQKCGTLNVGSSAKVIAEKITEGDGYWAHSANGYFSEGSAIIVESCNYPGGAPAANIDAGATLIPFATSDWTTYKVLVINHKDNESDSLTEANMTGTTAGYVVANVVGHNSNGGTEPTDGWYHFTSENVEVHNAQ